MSGDDLLARIQHTFEAIASALKHWFEALSARLSHPEHDREYIRTVPGSTVVSDVDQQHVIDLFGESIRVDKARIEQGELLIRKEVITETQMIAVPVTREELVVERRSKDGRTLEVLRGKQAIRIPVSEERVIISKQTVLNERVKVSRRRIDEKKIVSVPVKHEEVSISSEGDAPIDKEAA
jgi:uncharacterized protein (TIGR02271 family)